MGRGPHTVPVRALLRHAGVGSPRGRDPRGSRSRRTPPPPASRSLWGGGASPRLRGGGGPLLWLPSWGGCGGGGGWGGRPPAPPPCRASACLLLPPACPPWGILVPWGLPGGRGRRARSGRPPTGQCGGGRGGGGEGNSPPLVRAPVFPGPASDKAAPFAPSWELPVRRRPAAGRACGRLPRPWCPRTPGAAAPFGGAVGPPSLRFASVCSWARGGGVGGEWGGPSGPLAPPPDGRGGGGGGMAVPAPGASHRLGGRTLPPPPST